MKTSSRTEALKSQKTNEEEEKDPPDSLIRKSKISQKEPAKEVGSFFISHEFNNNNFQIKISEGSEYSVNYPAGILSFLDAETKKVLLDNFMYTRTIPLVLFNKNILSYQAAKPLLKDFIDFGVLKDIPRISELTNIETKKLLESFNNSQKNGAITFKNRESSGKLSLPKRTSNKKALLSLSFGRDSLLSYGLAKEIGLECYPVFINDMERYNPAEFRIKRAIMKSFSEEQQQPILFLTDDTDNIFRSNGLEKKFAELDGTNAMLAFALELIPLAYYKGAKYIIFGNERNLNDFFVSKERFRVYPSYDQSSNYMKKKNHYLARFTEDNIQVFSLVEPLYNITEMKILYHRYPHLLKYLMSCFSKELSDDKWCYQCPTCASGFLSTLAIGGDPKKLGIKENLFEMKYKDFYPIFASKIKRVYEKPPRVKEEQLLSFLLAYKNGFKGELINLFKRTYLKKVQKKEKELRERYFKVYSTTTIPQEFKDEILTIYKEEFKDLI